MTTCLYTNRCVEHVHVTCVCVCVCLMLQRWYQIINYIDATYISYVHKGNVHTLKFLNLQEPCFLISLLQIEMPRKHAFNTANLLTPSFSNIGCRVLTVYAHNWGLMRVRGSAAASLDSEYHSTHHELQI